MISVIIPLYNKQDSIQNTILSVLQQKFIEFELVIVNDGSTDNSLSKVKAITDSRICLIEKENGGVSSARNLGITNAKFNFIAFLDGDDVWRQDHLEEVVKLIALFPDKNVFTTSFKYSNKDNRGSEDGYYLINEYFRDALKGPVICSITAVVRKESLLSIGGFNENLSHGEDLDIWARLGQKFTFVKSRKITAVYRTDSENRASRKNIPYFKSYISVLPRKSAQGFEKKYYDFLIRHKIKKSLRKMDLKSVFFLLRQYKFVFPWS